MTKLTRRAVLSGASALAIAPTYAPAFAQGGRTITLMHGFTPGANVDLVARLVADNLSKRLGQPIVVESRPGAGGTTSAATVARAAPDGGTLTVLPGGHAVSAAIYKQLPYNSVADFSFISMLTDFPFILVTYPDHPAQSIADVIRTAQADEGKLTCATAGNGTGMHLAFELFVAMAKAKIQHVPYRGSPQGITDLLAKRIDFQMDTPTVLLPFIKDGRLRALATSTAKRIAALPDLPPVAEAIPGYETITWQGFLVPAGTPKEIVDRLHAELIKALKDPEFASRMRGMGLEVYGTTPAEFSQFIRDENVKWTKVIKATGARVD